MFHSSVLRNLDSLRNWLRMKCLGLLDLGDVVDPRLVRLFYANLEMNLVLMACSL